MNPFVETKKPNFDLVKLAELRDEHREKVMTYRRMTDEARSSAHAAIRARLDAPPLPGTPPTGSRSSNAELIGVAATAKKIRPKTNDFYLQPLSVLQSYTREQLEDAKVDQHALSRIVAAEIRRERLKTQQYQAAASVRKSAAAMTQIEQFAKEARL